MIRDLGLRGAGQTLVHYAALGPGVDVTVTYDALGRAVEAQEPSGPIEFVYGPDGGKLAVMSGQTLLRADISLPGGGEAVYNAQGLAYYRHADHLGSSRLASTPARGVYAESASMYAASGGLAVAGVGALAGCTDPTPAEPFTCGVGLAASAAAFTSAAGTAAFATHFFTNFTLPAIKNWGCDD